jgi:hypothetical protein
MKKKIRKIKKAIKKTAKAKKIKKPAKKKIAQRVSKSPKPIGTVTHFYNDISVAIVKFKKNVRVGVELYFKGATTDFKEAPKSMQYDHKPIVVAPKGKQVGIKVKKRVREGDEVYG